MFIFALDGIGYGFVTFHIDEALQAISLCESGYEPFPMFIGAPSDVGGDARIENAVRAVGHDVDPAARHLRVTAWMAGSSPAMTDSYGPGRAKTGLMSTPSCRRRCRTSSTCRCGPW